MPTASKHPPIASNNQKRDQYYAYENHHEPRQQRQQHRRDHDHHRRDDHDMVRVIDVDVVRDPKLKQQPTRSKPPQHPPNLPAPAASKKFTGGLEFSGLTYTVGKKIKDASTGKWMSQDIDLLHRITGYAPKGCVTAVMGPSGAGKSTFLDGLAGRIASGSLKGQVSLDGVEISPSLIKRTSAYVMQDDRLFPMLTVYETLMFAADFRLGGTLSRAEKQQRVDNLIDTLGLTSSRNTYIGDEGTRGVSGGERRRVSIGVDIIHGPPLLFLDEPTSGLDSTSAHSVIEKVHQIARSGSTVILTIHQPSYRIQMLLDHLVILARGQLMFIGSPKEVGHHLQRMGRKVPKGENSIEYLLDVIQEYDRCPLLGVSVLADFCRTGLKPPKIDAVSSIVEDAMSVSTVAPPPDTPASFMVDDDDGDDGFDHSLRSHTSVSKSPYYYSSGGGMFTANRRLHANNSRNKALPLRASTGMTPYNSSNNMFMYSKDIVPSTPTPGSSDYTVTEADYMTPYYSQGGRGTAAAGAHVHLGRKFANSYFTETWILMQRNFTNIWRTPELFLSRQMVLTVMGFMMATMFIRPKDNPQGVTDRISFYIFTVCLFFFSSNDAVPAFIQERFIFIRETSHNAYRASSYVISGLFTYLPFFALQALTYALLVWFAIRLYVGDNSTSFLYFLLVLYMSLMSTNSFVVFISSIVPNFILGYAAVIAFTALFFLFCGYFVSSHDIPIYWKWMNIVSTMKYPYEGLLMNQFQTNRTFIVKGITGQAITGFDILHQLSISTHESSKWRMLLYMFAWAVFYRILFYLVLRFASNNKRT